MAIYNLMEDAATAEISRSQVWQWLHRPNAALTDGRRISTELYRGLLSGEMEKIKSTLGAAKFAAGKYEAAHRLFDQLVTAKSFVEFLTLAAYEQLE